MNTVGTPAPLAIGRMRSVLPDLRCDNDSPPRNPRTGSNRPRRFPYTHPINVLPSLFRQGQKGGIGMDATGASSRLERKTYHVVFNSVEDTTRKESRL